MGKSKAGFSILVIFLILLGLAKNLYAANRFLDRGIVGYKAWSVETAVAYQYKDNLVLKPSSEIPDVVITGERDSGMITDFRVGYNPHLKEPWILYVQYDSYTKTYFDNHQVNLIQQTASLVPGYNFPKGHSRIATTQRYCRVSNLKLQGDYYKAIEVVLQRTLPRRDNELEFKQKIIEPNQPISYQYHKRKQSMLRIAD